MQFRWNLQLLARHSLFRNLLCSTTNLLTVMADRISVALNNSVVTRSITVDILNVFWEDRAYYWSSSQNKVLLCVWQDVFFLLSHFLVAEDCELSKSTSNLQRVPLTLEYVPMMIFCVRLLSELIIPQSAYHVTKHLTCRNNSEVFEQ